MDFADGSNTGQLSSVSVSRQLPPNQNSSYNLLKLQNHVVSSLRNKVSYVLQGYSTILVDIELQERVTNPAEGPSKQIYSTVHP